MPTRGKQRRNPGDVCVEADRQFDAGNFRSAFRLFLSCAKAGEYGCQLNLGYCYDVGKGVKVNRRQAFHWYRRAWRQGCGAAASNIGTIYRDENKTRLALSWFERAVSLQDTDANLEIAKIHRKRGNSRLAARYLKLVARAKPGAVIEHSREEALRLLRGPGLRG